MFYLCKKNNMIYLDEIFECEHEFVVKEYKSQTCGTCLACGDLIFK